MNKKKIPALFMRRSAALCYDALILFALFFVITAIAVSINDGEHVGSVWLRLLFLLTTYAFYGWFWLHGGQTLGMRAWRLRLVSNNGQLLTLKAVTTRFFAAILSWIPFGLGHLWILVDAHKLAWHDRLSQTCVVYDTANEPGARRSNHASQ